MIDIIVRGYQIHFIGALDDRAHKIAYILKFDKKDRMQVYTDVRKCTIDAVYYFIQDTYPALLLDHDKRAKWAIISNDISRAFNKWKSEWIQKYQADKLYDNVGKKLMKHQLQCVWSACYKQYNLFALGMGVGKSLTAASISKLYNVQRTLIISPSLVKWNWVRDLSDEFGFDENTFTVLDRNKKVEAMTGQEKFVVVNYESIPRFKDEILFREIGHIIIDECHYIKSTKTKRFKLVKEIVDSFPKSRVTLLSGTPVTNRITDLFAYLNLCHVPVIGGNIYGFNNKYAKKEGKKIVGVQNVKELRGVLSNFMIRKKTSDCVELPEIRTKKYYIGEELKSVAKYKKTFDEMVDARERYIQIKDEWDKFKVHYNPDDPKQKEKSKWYRKEVFNLRTKSRGNLVTLNKLCSISKIDSAIELIDSIIAQGEKVIVFSGFRDPLHKLRYKYIDRSVYIDGSVPALKRQQEIDAFKKDKDKKVFIGQTIASGIGVNLVNSSHVIFMDLPFTSDKIEQAQQRAWRKGQTKDVDVMYLILENSVDERIFNLVKEKGKDIAEVIDKGNADFDYEKITDKLIDELVEESRKERGLPSLKQKGFVKV